jgi:hypothetical protein
LQQQTFVQFLFQLQSTFKTAAEIINPFPSYKCSFLYSP